MAAARQGNPVRRSRLNDDAAHGPVHHRFENTINTILARYASEEAALPVTVRLCGWGEQTRPAPARGRRPGHHPRPGIAYLDVPDGPPAVLTIVWPPDSRSMAVAALVRAATEREQVTPPRA